MRRVLRRRILPGLVLLVIAAVVGAWLYSRSAAAAHVVERRLQDRLGTMVRFDSLAVGVTGTTISALRIHERDASPDSTPFITVGEADLDVAAIGAIRGDEPSTIRLRNAQILLRFDRHGNLLTKLPSLGAAGGSVPTMRFESGTLSIRQEGRTDSVFRGIDLSITTNAQGLSVAGTINDSAWGTWTAEGSIPTSETGIGRLTLQTAKEHAVTPELLRQVPLVNPHAWTHVRLDGITPARFDLSIDMATERVAYRIALKPTRTTVDVAKIGLHVEDAAGGLVAEANTVTLTNVRGQSAGGEIHVDSRMEFNGPDSVLRFRANLTRMDVQKLPASWRVPPDIDGRLSGKIDLVLTIPASGGVRLDAIGRATINDARLKGRPVPPIELDVGGGPDGELAFANRHAGSPFIETMKPVEPTSSRRPGLVGTVLRLAARLNKPGDEKEFLHVNVKLRDVDVAELLKTTGVDFTTPIGGKANVSVQLEIPTDVAAEFRNYRLTGTISSPRVTVDELAVEEISAKLDMRDGKFFVRDLVGKLPAIADKKVEASSIRVDGEVEVDKAYAFRAKATADRLPLEHLNRLKNALGLSVVLSGDANVQAELTGTLSPLAVRSSGTARVASVHVDAITADDLAFRWESDADLIRFRDARVRVFSGRMSGNFDVPLRDEVAGAGQAKIENIDLGELSKALFAGANVKMEGKADGTVTMRTPKAAEPRGATADVLLQAPSMTFQGVAAKKILGAGVFAAGVFKYTLSAAALGGVVEVTGQYPPEKKAIPSPEKKTSLPLNLGKVRVRRIQLSALADALGFRTQLGELSAEISGEFPLTTDEESRLVGTGRIHLEHLKWKNRELATTGQAIVRLTPKSLTLDDAMLFAGEGVARIHATFDRADPDRSEISLALTSIPAERILFLFPSLAKRIDMNIDGRFATTIGREWRGSGVVTASKGRLYGIPVTEFRAPLVWSVSPSRGRSEIRMRDATAAAAGGTISGNAEVNLFNDLPPRLAGDVQFRNANVSQAFRDASRVAGKMQITGKLEFAAEQYRGPDDLTAKFDAKLGESQPFNLPVFAALVPFLGLGRDYSTTIREGEVHAVLGRGVWRVQQIALSGPSIDLYADGTVTLDGRLSGAVTARSGERPTQTMLRRIVPVAPLANVTPSNLTLSGSALTNAASLVGNYVIYMEVAGTIDSPVVRLQTIRTLSDAVVRFFLFRFLTPIP